MMSNKVLAIVFTAFVVSPLLGTSGAEAFSLKKTIKKIEKQIKSPKKFRRQGVSKNLDRIITKDGIRNLGVIAIPLAFSRNKHVGSIAGAIVAVYVVSEISRKLNEDQNNRMANSTLTALATGEDSEWSSEQEKTSGRSRVVETKRIAQPVNVKVNKEKVEEVPPLEFIGAAFTVDKNSNVRGGPGTDYSKVGRLKSGHRVNVVGKVIDEPWYLVSENGVASGFVYSPLLSPAGASFVGELETETERKEAPEIYEVAVADTQNCRSIEQSITLADGTETSETITACQGANGWELQDESAVN